MKKYKYPVVKLVAIYFFLGEYGFLFRTKMFDGNGLGLALVKKFREINKAEIKVDSQLGKGSIFTVTFS
jgi:light-regulated signal transduction histidine kinase (bacteriophytochrome)